VDHRHPVLLAASALYLVTVVAQTATADPVVGAVATVVRTLVWLVFAASYVLRVVRSRGPVAFVLSHPLQLLVLLVPGVLVALVLARAVVDAGGPARPGRRVVRRTVVTLAVVATSLVLLLAAAVLIAERGAEGALIVDYAGAVWWAFATVATVGYGDLVPVTQAGRALAVGGMLLGIGVIGTLTAGIAAHVTRLAQEPPDAEDAEDEQGDEGEGEGEGLTLVLAELRALRAEVAVLRQAAGPEGPGGPGDAPAAGAGPVPPRPPG
jgi:voltage-gated potassium channel